MPLVAIKEWMFCGEFTPALMDPLMYRARLIHMVTLVGAATCIEKGEVTGNQQRRTVVGHRIGTGKDCTSLAVRTVAVGKKERLFCRKAIFDDHPFADKTASQHGAGIDPRRTGNDKITGSHIRPDVGRRHS